MVLELRVFGTGFGGDICKGRYTSISDVLYCLDGDVRSKGCRRRIACTPSNDGHKAFLARVPWTIQREMVSKSRFNL